MTEARGTGGPTTRAVDLAAACRSLPLLGRRVRCPLCGWSFRHFIEGGRSLRRKDAGYCPRCNSKVRHRWLWMQLAPTLQEHDASTLDLLHVAPAHASHRALTRLPFGSHVTVDVEPSRRTTVVADITSAGLRASAFDLVICMHVLEHVDDDIAAIAELHRVVRPTGLVAIGVPVRVDTSTIEDPNVTDPRDRAELFGEPDHRRWYGTDIVERLETAGFAVQAELTDRAAPEIVERYGLKPGEGLFLCRRADAPATDQAK